MRGALLGSPRVRDWRIALPLSGEGRIGGNVRLVLCSGRGTVAVHVQVHVRTRKAGSGEALGLDAGVTDVFAACRGEKLGQGFGRANHRANPVCLACHRV